MTDCSCGFCTQAPCDCCACRHRAANLATNGATPTLVPDDHPELVAATRDRDSAQRAYEKAHAVWADAEATRRRAEADLAAELDRRHASSAERERVANDRLSGPARGAQRAREAMDARGREAVEARQRHDAVYHRLTQEAISAW